MVPVPVPVRRLDFRFRNPRVRFRDRRAGTALLRQTSVQSRHDSWGDTLTQEVAKPFFCSRKP